MSVRRNDLCERVARIARTRVHAHHGMRVLRNAEEIMPAIFARIGAARRSVWMEIYTIKTGKLERALVQELARAARRGVNVRILADAVGSRTLPHDYAGGLARRGVALSFYRSPLAPQAWQRNHTKLVVVDGDVAFTGGLSIDDVFLGANGGTEWRETMIEIEGPVIRDMARTFAEDWRVATHESVGVEEDRAMVEHGYGGDAQFIVSTRRAPCIESCFAEAVRSATASVFATTPYFVPHGVIANELRAAAERGVDVRVLIPGDHHSVPFVRAASRAIFGTLLRSGVRVFEYRPSMVHAKTLVVDSAWSTIGSTNLDPLSLRYNREANVVTCDQAIAARLEDLFLQDVAQSDEVTLQAWRRRGWGDRIFELLVRPMRSLL